jgi:acetolactate synthase-1/2/3 large subunit
VQLSGADLIVRLLERQGITTLAGVPGGANLPLYDALARRGRPRHVLARHEQGAGFIAQGMARALGTPQVCLATSGPGATNVLTAVADARLDSVPLVCITGQVPLALIGTDAFQEVDTYGLTVPITKHNYLVRSAGELLAERARNRGEAATHEVFMRHRSPLMRVDLSSVPAGSTVLAARLVIVRANDKVSDDHDPSKKPTMWVIEPCNRPWKEHEVNTFEYAPDRFWRDVGGMSWFRPICKPFSAHALRVGARILASVAWHVR